MASKCSSNIFICTIKTTKKINPLQHTSGDCNIHKKLKIFKSTNSLWQEILQQKIRKWRIPICKNSSYALMLLLFFFFNFFFLWHNSSQLLFQLLILINGILRFTSFLFSLSLFNSLIAVFALTHISGSSHSKKLQPSTWNF